MLIVDDSAAIRQIVQRAFKLKKLPVGKVLEAGDGLEALESLKSHTVDIIFADINMPHMDGLQFLAAVRAVEKWKAIPIVMITTEGSEHKVREALQLGASGYMRKPFTAEQVKEKLAAVVSFDSGELKSI
ncbi:MAG TPA: response regulator [Bryobacteraceae bacterium]|nr:response regulator [Bryobacteraceae bacterium]